MVKSTDSTPGGSLYVSRSVAEPLGRLATAMAEVGRGDFTVRCAVQTDVTVT